MGVSMSNAGRHAADEVRSQARRPWVEKLLRAGWFAKGLVYVLMGWVALSFVGHRPAKGDQASPEGALGVVANRPGGAALLYVLAAGLVLYSLWRVVTVLDVRGGGAKHHVERVAFAFSAVFYAFLAYTAFRNARAHTRPNDSFTVERISADLLSRSWGRVALFVVAAVVLAAAAVFAYRALTRKFTEGIRGLAPTLGANHGSSKLLFVLGMAGWLGRAVVVALIGFFIGRAALRHDARDASGFDHALRRAAEGGIGRVLVIVAGVGLILYGLYCGISAPRRDVGEKSS